MLTPKFDLEMAPYGYKNPPVLYVWRCFDADLIEFSTGFQWFSRSFVRYICCAKTNSSGRAMGNPLRSPSSYKAILKVGNLLGGLRVLICFFNLYS